MSNADIRIAEAYHDRTIHTHFSVRSSGHYLDFDNQPIPFKIYEDLPRLPLPNEWAPLELYALEAIASPGLAAPGRAPTLEDVARLLHLSAGITKKVRYPHGHQYFRAAANTGALYEIDLYVACGPLPDLEAGVYHFSPQDFSLRVLRKGDFRPTLAAATAGETSPAPLVLICTGTYWRNAWKYQARTYRHFGWDNGTMLANTLAVAAALRLSARVVCGFVDDDVNRLLDLDTDKEVAFSLVAVGQGSPVEGGAQELSPIATAVRPLSDHDVDYPVMRELHAASSLPDAKAVEAWRG